MNVPQLKSKFRPINEILYESNSAAIISASIETGLFDVLSEKKLTAGELASELGTVPETTEALANALAAMGILEKREELFSLTVQAEEFLVSHSNSSQVDVILKSQQYNSLIKELPRLIKDGSSRQTAHSDEMWADMDIMKMMGRSALGGQVQDALSFITSLSEFSSMESMCDLAGNHGYYTMPLLDMNPELHGTICDLSETVKFSEKIIRENGYEDRIDTLPADIATDSIGSDYDMVFCSHVLYKWGKTGELTGIMKKVNRSLNSGGIFVSNHMTLSYDGCYPLSGAIMELTTRLGGYPTHSLDIVTLNDALEESGFEIIKIKPANESSYYNSLLLAARKVRDEYCLLYTSPSPRDVEESRMPSSA